MKRHAYWRDDRWHESKSSDTDPEYRLYYSKNIPDLAMRVVMDFSSGSILCEGYKKNNRTLPIRQKRLVPEILANLADIDLQLKKCQRIIDELKQLREALEAYVVE